MSGSLPNLFEFTDRFEERSERFAVVTVHAPDVESFEELDPHLERLLEKRWDRSAFPFPILLDASGETVKRYGVSGYPTSLLIGPEGTVLAAKDGQRKLEELLSRDD